MSNIKEVKIINRDWTCGDGCCYEWWYECEIHLDSGEVIKENILSEYNHNIQVRYSSEFNAKVWACKYAKDVLGYHLKFSSNLFTSRN